MIERADFDEYYVKNLNEYNNTIQTLISEHPEIYFRGVNQARFNLAPSITRNKLVNFSNKQEEKLFNAFRRRVALYKSETYREYTSTKAQLDIETLAIAQHHGLKTRLLDWSTNPLSSLWFACEDPNIQNADSYCVVWVLIAPTKEDNRWKFFKTGEEITTSIFEFNETFMYIPNIVDPRIKNQSGLFSVHHYDEILKKHVPLDENKIFFPHKFDTKLKFEPEQHWDLIKIQINRELYGEDILKNLRRFDVHEETIYPSLEKASSRLNADFDSGVVF